MVRFFQVFWGLGAFAWNFYGAYQIQNGGRPLGPTASWMGALMGLVLAVLFWTLKKDKTPWPYVAVSFLGLLAAGLAIYGAFTKDHGLWPGEEWRWAGILLNGIGVAACLAGIFQAGLLSRR